MHSATCTAHRVHMCACSYVQRAAACTAHRGACSMCLSARARAHVRAAHSAARVRTRVQSARACAAFVRKRTPAHCSSMSVQCKYYVIFYVICYIM